MPGPEELRRLFEQGLLEDGRPRLPEDVELEKLKGITRRSRREITLTMHGDRVVVDGSMVLSYRRSNSPRYSFRDVFIERERTERIVFPESDQGEDVCVPFSDEEERRSTFSGEAVGLKSDRGVAYVGTKYKLTFLGRKDSDHKQFLW